MTQEEFIQKAKSIHGDKYDYSKVEYINAKTDVIIICKKCGTEFKQRPELHLRGAGCKYCTHRSYKYTLEEFIEKAIEIHGNKYDYSKVLYKNKKSKVIIICPIHGEFKQTPEQHLNGHGCKKCAIDTLWKKRRETLDTFKTKIIKKYGDIYDFSRCIFKNMTTDIIVGYEGRFFKITPSKLLHGYNGGPILHNRVYNTEDFIKRAKEIYGDKYDYSQVDYINSTTDVCIICPEHGPFKLTPNEHLQGQGCIQCSKENKRSKLEESVFQFLLKNNINFEEQYSPSYLNDKFSHQKCDFFLPEYNIVIECQGKQHFKPMKLFGGEEGYAYNLERDLRKYQKIKDNGLRMLYFLERHISISGAINKSEYNAIYNSDNTFRDLNKLLVAINE